MDYLVAVNVDQFLLDCLEEELPCVTFPPEVPGSSPLELIENFHACTSMRHGKGNYLRGGPKTSTSSRKNSLAVSEEEEAVKTPPPPPPPPPQSSTILKRLLTSNAAKASSSTSLMAKKKGKKASID